MKNSQPRLTTTGKRITQRMLRRAVWINIAAGSLGMMWVATALGMPITMLMESLNAPAVLIGLVVTVQQLAMMMQIPGAYVSEHLSSRKKFWGTLCILHRALWIMPAIIPLIMPPGSAWTPWAVLAAVTLSAVLAQTVTASWFSWMADLIPEQMRGRFWGVRQTVVMACYLVAMGATGFILDRFPDPSQPGGSFIGFTIVFVLGAFLGIADIVVHLWVPEPRPAVEPKTTDIITRIKAPLRNRDFRRLTFSFGLWQFAIGIIGSFGIVYLKRAFGVSYIHLSAITISASVGTVISGLIWGHVMDTIGARAFGAVMMILGPAFGVIWFFLEAANVAVAVPFLGTFVIPQPILLLLVGNLLTGALYSGVGLAQLNLSAAFAPEKGKTMAMAVHWTVVGIIGSMGPFVGGLIADWIQKNPLNITLPTGTPMAFFHILVLIHMAAVWLLALPILLRIAKRGREFPVSLLVGNPLRSVSIIYSLIHISSSTSPAKRARAVRRLGRKKPEAMLSEIIAKLDDPSSDVREEAARALGRVGTPEAVDALVQKLEDPHSHLAPQIARALRESKSPRSVDALVKRLGDSDRETLSESARALGEIGDQRATPPLLDLLQKADDEKVISASSDALARLGELAAIYEILPRMKSTRNPVLRRSLAVAVGELLGDKDRFYEVLVKEEDSRGSATSVLLADLLKDVKSLKNVPQDAVSSLTAQIEELEAAYEDDDVRTSSELLFKIAVKEALLLFAPADEEIDDEAFIDDLIWRDQRFGIGLWYLDLLLQHWQEAHLGRRDWIDLLLGIYFLCCWSREATAASR